MKETNWDTVVFNNVIDEFVFEYVEVGNELIVELILALLSTVGKVFVIPELDGLTL